MTPRMHKAVVGRSRAFRSCAAIAFAIATSVGASGCGGGEAVVASVGTHAITAGMLEHWISVVAAREHEAIPSAPVPQWVRPDPPKYTACVAHLEGKSGAARTPAAAAQFKVQCARQYEELRELVLGSLITAEWLIGEGERRGMKVSESEARRRLAEVTKNQFGSETAFRKYLQFSGETLSDQLFRARIKLFSFKIEAQVLATGHSTREQEIAYAKFTEAFPREWAARTNCRKGFVVANCRQYKGASAPAMKLL